jgi:ABC-2 type transport system ATP-binding protein
MGTNDGGIQARDLELHTRRGEVYPPTSFDIEPGTVTAVLGPARSGRTALLLTISGRMRPTGGRATTAGHDVVREARKARSSVGLGVFGGLNDLDEPLTPEQHLAERRLMLRGRGRLDASALLRRVGLAGLGRRPVSRLTTEQCVRLGIALALIGEPPVIAIDDLDRDLEPDRQAAVIATLREIACEGTTVVFTCIDARTASLADATVTLPAAPDPGEASERETV